MPYPSSSPSPRLRFLAMFLATCFAGTAQAAVIRVPLDQPDVRAATAAAASGDTVLLSPGTHVGGAFINGKRLTFASRYIFTGDTATVSQTILSGDAGGGCGDNPGCTGNSVLEFGDNASGSVVIGLTLTNGENGVGSASTVDVIHCRLIANGDGADYSPGAGGTLRANLFLNNKDDGIDLNGRMNMTVVDNDIRDNADDGIEYRMHTWSGAAMQVSITGNRITGNREDGVQLIDYTGTGNYTIRIEHNLFQSNYDALGLSAAIAFMPNGETVETLAGAQSTRRTYVLSNTFVGEKNGLVGGASVIVLNNIFTGVTGTALSRVAGTSIASYNLFWSCGINYDLSVTDVPHFLFSNPQLTTAARLADGSPAINAGTAFFLWRGETVLNLPSSSFVGAAPDLGAYESAPNLPPLVSAGPDRTISLSSDVVEADAPGAPLMRADAPLAGTASDDGQPGPVPTLMWTKVSGPGPVVFENPIASQTRATFSVPGNYVLQLTVSDGQLTSSDQVQITVLAPTNLPPFVDAGHDQSVVLPARAQLSGTVLDDGMPNPPGAVTTSWSSVAGPGPVIFQGGTTLTARAVFSLPGTYVLRLTASDGGAIASDTVTVTVLPVPNSPPMVDAGAEQTVTLPNDAILDATVNDDGLPNPPGALTTLWSLASGPGTVVFQDTAAVDTRAAFAVPGTYVLRLSASDGASTASDTVTVTVLPVPNQGPTVDAGTYQTVTLPADAALDATVSDDGLPSPPGAVTTLWTVALGPAPVAFQDSSAVDTRATFSTPGIYVLRLSASDGVLSASDTVSVTVLPVVNTAPVVDAGPDQTIPFPLGASLDATVSDDGLPSPPGALTVTWTEVIGPGTVTFQNANAIDTRADFSAPGVYALRLRVSDGALSAQDLVQITVQPPPPAWEGRIATGSDDSEEDDNGHVVRNGSRLDLVYTTSGNQFVGLRFTGVAVPPGAIVLNAWVQFEADAASSELTSLNLQAQASDDADPFGTGHGDLSLRPRTASVVSWEPAAWTAVGEAGLAERTSDLTPVIQEVVNRPGWASGGAMAIIVSGSGHRAARSYETLPAGAALLHIEYGGVAGPLAAREETRPVALAPAPAPTAPPATTTAPLEFALRGVSPQPARGSMTISFTLAAAGRATLELHDVAGRRVMSREVGALGPGAHTVELSERLAAGVYMVRLTQAGRTLNRKAIVLP